MSELKPTEKELQILQILWDSSECTVRDVHARLYPNDEAGYTSTLKLMQIMFEKGMVSREKKGKTHLYRAELKKKETQSQIVGKLLDTVFKGAAGSLVMQVLGQSKNTTEELNEIKKLIEEIEKSQHDANS